MRKQPLLAALLLLALGLADAAGASPQRDFAFGRLGGNIQPYTVSIRIDGRVHVSGPVAVDRTKLTAAQLATLDRATSAARFASLPAVTNCPAVLPDIAATFIRVGARTVRVHGGCVARYAKLFTALTSAVRLSTG
jgi:hypothetical protein